MISLFSNPKPITHFFLPLSSPSSRLLFVSLFSTTPPLPSRRDEESRNARVSVWWDIENCGVPAGINVFKIAQSIMKAVRVNGIKGPVQISAYGDVLRIPKPILEGLSVTGVNLVHVPNGGKNSADRLILVDLMSWVSQNPPPAHIFLISGDRDFAGVLHRLRMNNYNILLAGTPCISSAVLCSASSIMWDWGELARRENFSGRHFNQPPDGSWYGYYRGPLEDPFKVLLQQNNSLKASDSSDEAVSSEKDPQVPNAAIRQRKVVPAGDGLLFVRSVTSQVRKSVESDEISERPITEYGTRDVQMGVKASDKKALATTRAVEIEQILTVSSYNGAKEKVVEEKVGEAAENKKELLKTSEKFDSLSKDEADSKKELRETSKKFDSLSKDVVDSKKELHEASEKFDSLSKDEVDSKKELQGKETLDASETLSEEQYPKSEMGVFRNLWKKWFSGRKDGSISKEKLTKSSNQDEIISPSVSSSSNGLSMDAKNSGSCKSEDSEGFVVKVMSWFRPLENESSNNTLTGQSIQEPDMIEDSSKYEGGQNTSNQEVFSDDFFWRDIESFLKTYNASRIVLKATSREQFVRSLQNEGPLILRSLQENDLLHLVDLLVSDKKWIGEFPSKIPRFRVILPPEKSSATSQPHNINGLSSIFLSSSHGKRHSIVHNSPSNKRLEILGDCRKLVDELLERNPDGFNMSCFSEQFIERYGYPLDHQKLGYLKLSSLLEIMPRVKTQYQMVFPKAKSSGSDSGMSDLPQKHEDDESPWVELGPVSKNSKSDQEKLRNVYEPCKSEDDEFSDVEEEGSEQRKSGVNEHESSLLRILDSWYSSNGERSSSDQNRGLESVEEYPNDEHKVFSSTVNRGRKGRPQKSYVFVSDLEGRQRQAN